MTTKSKLKPREVICIFPVEVPTDEGDKYVFAAIDVATEYAFQPLHADNNKVQNLLKYLSQLLMDEKFLLHKHQPFTLVLHKYEQHFAKIEQLIRPHGGISVKIDDGMLIKTMTPFIGGLYERLSSQLPDNPQ